MESLGGGSVTFYKFHDPGDTVAGVFESVSFDQPGRFGPESNIRLVGDDGGAISVKMSTSLRNVIKTSQGRLVAGKTKLVIKYLGEQRSKKDPSKTYKAFDVQAEGLLPKGLAAAAAALAATEGDSTEPAGEVDTSFDPKKLS